MEEEKKIISKGVDELLQRLQDAFLTHDLLILLRIEPSTSDNKITVNVEAVGRSKEDISFMAEQSDNQKIKMNYMG